jgi:arsenical pump membrane protein
VAGLYACVFLVGTLVTAVLSLDATAIVLTPVVHATVVRLRLSPLPFMFACVYTANTASLFLPVSNLTNLLVYEGLDLHFGRFALVMLLPASLAVLTNFLLFALLFRRDLRGAYPKETPRFVPENVAFFRVATGSIAAILVAFFVAPALGLPIGPIALAAGVGLTVAARLCGWTSLREVAGSVSWGVIFLVVGLFVVVQGAENAGLAALAREVFARAAPGDSLPQLLALAFGAALGSNLINNVPMTLLSLGSLGPLVADGTLREAAAYAVLLGTNVGPNLTTVGSLATLIWLAIARGRGLDVTARDYLKVGALATAPILLAATLGLWASLRLFGT